MAYRAYKRNTRSRSRPLNRRSSRPARTTHWYRTRGPIVGLTAGPVNIDLLPDAVFDPGARLGSTVERVRLNFRGHWNAAQTLTPQWVCYLGLYVGPEDVNDTLGPGSHANQVDWMMYQTLPPLTANSWVVDVAPNQAFMTSYEFDVKSKRRFYEPTDKLWLTAELYLNQGVTVSMEPAYTASVLIKK